MKPYLLLLLFIVSGKITFAQNVKQSIDYQFNREGKNYYAFELFKNNKDSNNDYLMLNFTSNSSFKKIDKILIKTTDSEFKLKFKVREEQVKSDNPGQKFYPIVIDYKSLSVQKLNCDAQIIFKLDDGSSLALPFNICSIKQILSRN
ncbi:hypothetical protein [Pedobacter nototheniae]|uniref:hypothetical protein n=1 Tax=Pedobacter nototheniae TaxID=2488994 RepID=UPI00292F6609|nr:hypothetical protein [Pedobacter nototheniae]